MNQVISSFNLSLQPYKLHGQEKQQAARAFKALIKPHFKAYELSIPSGKRIYSRRGRQAMIRNLDLANQAKARLTD